MKFFDRIHRRRANADRALAESEHQRERIEAQWPEVRERTAWAKETRDRNHLTALFITTLGGKP